MSTTVAAIMQSPLGESLTLRLMPPAAREVRQVTLLEDFGVADALRTGAIVVLGRALEASASGYALDVLVRRCVERDVAALVMRRSSRRSPTAEALALRGGVTLLDVRDDADSLQVLGQLVAAVSGDARTALMRLAAAANWIPDDADDAGSMLTELSRLSGVDLALGDPGVGVDIDVDGRVVESVVTREHGEAALTAQRIAADLLSRALTSRERAIVRPLRSTSSALSQLILCSQANLAAISERALEAGLQVHGWHCVTRLAVDDAEGNSDDSALAVLEDEALAFVSRLDRDPRASWTVASPDASLVIVRTTKADPRWWRGDPVPATIETLIEDVMSRHPLLRFRIGIATSHEGPSGLRTSAEEARTALASARLSDESVSVATFDSLGLRRMLAEWLVTDNARETVNSLLAPLDALGPDKGAIAVATLHAYLDERGSLKRAAARLNVHRNAVVYRMAQITRHLAADLDDPDRRFALQLACRARLLTEGRA